MERRRPSRRRVKYIHPVVLADLDFEEYFYMLYHVCLLFLLCHPCRLCRDHGLCYSP